MPAGRAGRDSAGRRLVILGEQGERVDARQDGKGGDCARASKRPCGPQPQLAGGERRLDALGDVKAAEHVLVGVQFDCGSADGAEKLPAELSPLRVEKCPADCLRLVCLDAAE